jgi:SAM-dependent methyltransferase
MKIRLPERKNIKDTSDADPLKFHYMPIARWFFIARLADAIRLLAGQKDRLLDVGCGSGIFLPELSKHCKNLFACDVHPKLDLVREMLAAESVDVTLSHADACSLPYASESMDAVVCMSVLEHLHDLKSPADEFFRVLRGGGVAIVGVPVTNLMSTAMLRTGYFIGCPDARLEDEHVSNDIGVHNALVEKLEVEDVLHIPRLVPRSLRMYRTVRFRKPYESIRL